MKQHESKIQNQQERVDRGPEHSNRDCRSVSGDLVAGDQDRAPVMETAFEPAMDSHAALLMTAQSDSQRAGLMRQLHRSYGNAYVQRLLTSIGAQAKLTVSDPDDIYEQEAERVAQDVVRVMGSAVQRQAEEEEEEVQTKPASELRRQAEQQRVIKGDNDGGAEVTEALESRIEAARAGGRPLSDAARASLEPMLGYDFSHVRVHTDAEADEFSRQLQADAFATANDIFFRNGVYQPESLNGKALLAHELTHVVQQRRPPLFGGPTEELLLPLKARPHQLPHQPQHQPPRPSGPCGTRRS